MLELNWSDVISTLTQIRGYLIAIGAIIAVAVIVMIACLKLAAHKKYVIRTQAFVAMIVGIAIVANLICTGPMYTILSLASGTGTLTEESIAGAEELAQQIAEEGIVLLQNDDQTLPLADNKNINVFGWASTAPCYGGTGSGALNDSYHIVDLLEGLSNAGFNTNTELSDFYRAYAQSRPEIGMFAQDWTLPEPPAETYSDEMMENAREFSENAMIVLTRAGGEQTDLPRTLTGVTYNNNSEDYEDFPEGTHYLEPSQSERNMIDLVCRNFDNVILVYNGANTMELQIADEYEQIKSVLWVPGTGQNGFNALGEILSGEVNPSAKTADTFVRDLTATPNWNNFGDYEYDNMDEFVISESDPYVPGALPHFVNYTDGIYVGYKFYETAAEEGLIDYEELVQYPFGYGLSYTDFTQEMGEMVTGEDGTISFDVTVTNTGDVAGKDVVEVYYNPPYTNGGIEKASANLIAYDKTDMLEPGASQTLSISISAEDMASYDDEENGCYVLEEGEYVISINSDSHTVIDSQTYEVESTIVYDENNARSTDLVAAQNQFDFAKGELTYLSRENGFENYEEAVAAPATYSMPEADKAGFVNNSNFEPEEDPDAQMPTTGAKNNISILDLRGADYDDEKWEMLLDNLTIDEMVEMIALGGYQTAPAKSIDKIATTDCDGPAALNNNFTGVGSIGFPAGVMLANCWNEDLAYAFGENIGLMADDMNVSGWYAPAMNIHRSAFAGRNFEYYSEDALLSGKCAVNAVSGAWSQGVYAYIKHFALNDQETNRWEMLCVWADEQAIREIYLKPFEMCVKDGDATAVMSSYNYIGNQWAGACSPLLINVLRNEWGFRGSVLTDYFADFGYMDAERAIYNGGSTCLINRDVNTNYIKNTDNPTTVQHMREACHDVLYTAVNSRGFEEENLSAGLMTWQIIMIAADVVIAVLLLAFEFFIVRKGYQKRKKNAVKIETVKEE
ncbi:MAG: glycoside hydrolase family 3 C-terminal domain-containing protein [Marvinbryantia sp.]|uniref:glycoside hydrolase family 3 C-terminal domain-containing protein n=1 Tax=Marvinbryantia sp. TaxID=2496532 RepID=UPI0025CCC784|nr:glycoside hydrolase family 3 C-terminal domain-containing protein [uncultured Marvinbryantia sp.]